MLRFVFDQNPEILCSWLNAEDEAMQLSVDGGNFGRPITCKGIDAYFSSVGGWFRSRRGLIFHERHPYQVYTSAPPSASSLLSSSSPPSDSPPPSSLLSSPSFSSSSMSSPPTPVGHIEMFVVSYDSKSRDLPDVFSGISGTFGYIGYFYVPPALRNQGIGSSILQQLCAAALTPQKKPESSEKTENSANDKHRIQCLVLLVLDSNKRAIKFYEKHGFEQMGAFVEKGITKLVFQRSRASVGE